MIKYIYYGAPDDYASPICRESNMPFLHDLYSCDPENDTVIVVFESEGGASCATEVLKNAIESWPGTIWLYGTRQIFSSAFCLFFNTLVPVSWDPHTLFMTHYGSSDLPTRKMKGDFTFDTVMEERVEGLIREDSKFHDELGISSEEREYVEKGHALYMNSKRAAELLFKLNGNGPLGRGKDI